MSDVVDDVRSMALEMNLQTCWHFAKYDGEPFSLVIFGDATRTYSEKLDLATKFKAKPFLRP